MATHDPSVDSVLVRFPSGAIYSIHPGEGNTSVTNAGITAPTATITTWEKTGDPFTSADATLYGSGNPVDPTIPTTDENTWGTSTLSNSNVVILDNFQRADRLGLGVTQTGQTWALTGAGAATTRIVSGRYTGGDPIADNTVYASIKLAAQPIRYGGSFSFVAGPGAGGQSVAIICSADATTTLTNMLHLVITTTSILLTWWQGASQNNFPVSQTLNTGFATPLLTDGTIYTIWVTVNGNAVHVELPDGTVFDAYDPHFSQVSGSLVIWELLYGNTSSKIPRWEAVAAYGSGNASFYGPLTATGGIDGTPIGPTSMSTVNARQIGVGTVSPLDLLHVQGGNARIGGAAQHTTFRIKADTGGYQPTLIFDEGLATPPTIYSGGNLNDLRIMTFGVDRLVIPQAGNVGINQGSPNSALHVSGPIATALSTKTAAYIINQNDSVILADATAAAFAATLPTAALITGRVYTIKKTDVSANAITVTPNGTEKIDGAATYALTLQNQFVSVVSNGANWFVTGKG